MNRNLWVQPSSASLLPDPSLSRRRRRSINSAKRCRVFEEIASTLPTILTSSARKNFVESILNGPRADISGPLGVMMVRDLVVRWVCIKSRRWWSRWTKRRFLPERNPTSTSGSRFMLQAGIVCRAA